MKISITGDLGSGKSSVAKILRQALGFAYLSTGQMQRNIAEEYGVNSLELNKIASKDDSIDDRIDSYLVSLNQSNENLIIDSRMAWHFVKDTFKLYLEVHSEVGAERVLGDKGRISEPTYTDRDSALNKLKARKSVENERFFDKYQVRVDDLSNYDVVINTSASSIESTGRLILVLFEAWRNKQSLQKFWISPRFVFPTKDVKSAAREQTESVKAEASEHALMSRYKIDSVKYHECYFIWNGHERCSEAISDKLDFIPLELLASDNQTIPDGRSVEQFVRSVCNMDWYHDWEAAHYFQFIKYPQLTRDEKRADL